jgi:hypothetical protein
LIIMFRSRLLYQNVFRAPFLVFITRSHLFDARRKVMTFLPPLPTALVICYLIPPTDIASDLHADGLFNDEWMNGVVLYRKAPSSILMIDVQNCANSRRRFP